MAIPTNFRDTLVPLTLTELADLQDKLVAQGKDDCADYVEFFIWELEADFDGCEGYDECGWDFDD